MSTLTKNYETLNVKQLKQLIEESDDWAEIRVWVEMAKGDCDTVVLEGRRLVGVVDDPNDKYVCLVAGYYTEDDSE